MREVQRPGLSQRVDEASQETVKKNYSTHLASEHTQDINTKTQYIVSW